MFNKVTPLYNGMKLGAMDRAVSAHLSYNGEITGHIPDITGVTLTKPGRRVLYILTLSFSI